MIKDTASTTALAVKKAVLARSGIYEYSYAEMLARGITPKVVKDAYKEYRPPYVLVAAKDKFRYAVVTKEHPSVIDSDTVKQVTEGVVGSNVDVVTLDTCTFGQKDVALEGEVALYTDDILDYFENGAKETSAQYIARTVEAHDGAPYDYVMQSIDGVSGLALTIAGRGGSAVRVYDSKAAAEHKSAVTTAKGDKKMSKKKGLLSRLIGVSQTQDSKISAVVMDNLKGYSGLAEAEKLERQELVKDSCSAFLDSEQKSLLEATIAECFDSADVVLAHTEEVTRVIDSLQESCEAHDEASCKAIFDAAQDSCGGKAKAAKDSEEEQDESKDEACCPECHKNPCSKGVEDSENPADEGKEEAKEAKDSMEAVLDSKFAAMQEALEKKFATQIEASVKKALGLEDKKQIIDSKTADAESEDVSFLASRFFG